MIPTHEVRFHPGAMGRLRCHGIAALAAALAIVLVSACAPQKQSNPKGTQTAAIQADPKLPVLVFHTASGGQARLGVELEATEAAREQGLMNVKSLPADQGQMFMFQDAYPNQDIQAPFWMKDTLIPLSIAFISADGHVQEILDMQPETLDYHVPQRPYRYAVEANLGWYSRHGIDRSATVDLSAVVHQ